MEPLLIYNKETQKLSTFNNIVIGEILVKEDGYYDYWPNKRACTGYWPAYLLKEIADILDKLNEPYDTQVKKFFNKNPPRASSETL